MASSGEIRWFGVLVLIVLLMGSTIYLKCYIELWMEAHTVGNKEHFRENTRPCSAGWAPAKVLNFAKLADALGQLGICFLP